MVCFTFWLREDNLWIFHVNMVCYEVVCCVLFKTWCKCSTPTILTNQADWNTIDCVWPLLKWKSQSSLFRYNSSACQHAGFFVIFWLLIKECMLGLVYKITFHVKCLLSVRLLLKIITNDYLLFIYYKVQGLNPAMVIGGARKGIQP